MKTKSRPNPRRVKASSISPEEFDRIHTEASGYTAGRTVDHHARAVDLGDTRSIRFALRDRARRPAE